MTDDGCVRVTSTKPIGVGEIIVYGGTGMATIGIHTIGVYAGAGPNYHVRRRGTAANVRCKTSRTRSTARQPTASVTGPDQSSVIEATAHPAPR